MEQYEQPQVEIFIFSAREAIAANVWPVNDEQVGSRESAEKKLRIGKHHA